ncbi:MAG TPA: hypothetical protein DF774_02335 [Rheinheimera sp.]|uniref:RecB family exonuclease n=1 Tax=Rheinheimera sp. TaxID=1869214 RepID=UPI000EF1128F|nr:PD-(D/E)XK nuclease family protein [Rheinheimera sp.]HCU64579.1 hypothetical protein [Rheinheimera sp.]
MSNAIRIRASSWSGLFDCAYKWEGQNLLGMRMPSSPRALLGTAIHAGTATFDLAKLNGKMASVDEAANDFINALHHPEYEVDWRADDSINKRSAEVIGLTLTSDYCNTISPRYEFAAVELEITPFNIDCGDGVIIQLTGTLDRCRIRKDNGGLGISDVKTGSVAVEPDASGKGRTAKTKGHAAQLGTYEILAEASLQQLITEPAEIIGMKTKGKPEIATGLIYNPRLVMLGNEDAPGLIEHAAVMLKSGLFPPNPSSWVCSQKYCPRWNSCIYKTN